MFQKLNTLAVFGLTLKPVYAKIEPYIGKYVPNSDSSEAKCPVSDKSSSDNGSCPETESPKPEFNVNTLMWYSYIFDLKK